MTAGGFSNVVVAVDTGVEAIVFAGALEGNKVFVAVLAVAIVEAGEGAAAESLVGVALVTTVVFTGDDPGVASQSGMEPAV